MNSDTVAGVDDPGRRSWHLRTAILRSVSRSFYLSIRFLPRLLREPIALAYLLARATDTVADTTRVPGTVRIEVLKMFSDGILGKASREMVVNQIASFVTQDYMQTRLLANKFEQPLWRAKFLTAVGSAMLLATVPTGQPDGNEAVNSRGRS